MNAAGISYELDGRMTRMLLDLCAPLRGVLEQLRVPLGAART